MPTAQIRDEPEIPLVKNFGTLCVTYYCNRWNDNVYIMRRLNRSCLVTVMRNIDLRSQRWTPATVNWCAMGSQPPRLAQQMSRALELAVYMAAAMTAGRIRAKFYKEEEHG